MQALRATAKLTPQQREGQRSAGVYQEQLRLSTLANVNMQCVSAQLSRELDGVVPQHLLRYDRELSLARVLLLEAAWRALR